MQREEDVLKLQAVSGNTKIVYGSEGLLEVALHPDAEIVVNAVVGSVGCYQHFVQLRRKNNWNCKQRNVSNCRASCNGSSAKT